MTLSSILRLSVLGLALAAASPGFAKIFYSKDESMALAFGPDATVDMLTLFPTSEEAKQIEELSKVKLESNMLTFYVGKKQGAILGYAAIENHTVRTKPETLLYVLTPEGSLRNVYTLAFHEPPEYMPPERWFEQLKNHAIAELSFSTDIQAITGATLSTRAALNGARKTLAAYQTLIKGKQP